MYINFDILNLMCYICIRIINEPIMQIDGTKTGIGPWHTEYRKTETKCRRCGMISGWISLRYDYATRQEHMKAMFERIQQPTLCRCEKCGGNTVQDYVSFDNDCPEEILNETK